MCGVKLVTHNSVDNSNATPSPFRNISGYVTVVFRMSETSLRCASSESKDGEHEVERKIHILVENLQACVAEMFA